MAQADFSGASGTGLGFPDDFFDKATAEGFRSTLPPEATSGGAVAMPLPAPTAGGMPLDLAGPSGLPLGPGAAPAPSPAASPAAGDGMQQVIADLVGRPLPPEPTESPGHQKNITAAIIADAMSALGGGKSDFVGALRKNEQLRIAQSAEARKNEIEWRKLALQGIQEIRQLKGADWTRFDQAVKSGLDTIAQADTPENKLRVAAAYGQASGSALVTDTLKQLAGSANDLQRLAGRVWPFLETADEKAIALATVNGLKRTGQGGQRATDQEIVAKIEAASAMPVLNTLMAYLPGVIEGVKGLPEEQQFDAAANIIRSVPGKGPAMADAMNGDAFVKEQYPRLLEVFSRMGLPLPGKQKEAAEKFTAAKATRGGTLAAEQTREAIAGAGQVAESVKAGELRAATTPPAIAGQARLEGEKTRMRQAAEEPFKIAAEGRAEGRAERKTRFDRMNAATGPAMPEEVDKLRDDFRKESETFAKVANGLAAVKASFANKTGVRRTIADQGLVYALAKVFDPIGVVREADYAAIAQSGTWGDAFTRAWNKVAEGGMLSQDLRNEIMVEAQKRYDAQLTIQVGTESRYEKLADKRQIDRERIVVDYRLPGAKGPHAKGRDVFLDAQGREVKVK